MSVQQASRIASGVHQVRRRLQTKGTSTSYITHKCQYSKLPFRMTLRNSFSNRLP